MRASVAEYSEFQDIDVEERAEADIIAEILTSKLKVDPSKIIIENVSTNCGTNAEQSQVVLDKLKLSPSRIVLIQDPTMQRRTQACFERAWQDRPEVEIVSYAAFIPQLDEVGPGYTITGSDYPVWDPDRFISLVLGEVPRLRDDSAGYGPNGRNFFGHVEVPVPVLRAYETLSKNYPELIREIPA